METDRFEEIVNSFDFRSRPRRSREFNSARARDRAYLRRVYGNFCWYCKSKFNSDNASTLDHLFPINFCKNNKLPVELYNNISNKRLSCLSCNRLKANYIPSIDEFYDWLNKLAST